MRKFKFAKRSKPTSAPPLSEKEISDADCGIDGPMEDSLSTTTLAHTSAPVAPLPPIHLKVKRVDLYFSKWLNQWKYKNMGAKVTQEQEKTADAPATTNNDAWSQFCFVVVRTLPTEKDQDPTFKVVIKSEYLLEACKDVIQDIPGLSWNANPVEVGASPRIDASRD